MAFSRGIRVPALLTAVIAFSVWLQAPASLQSGLTGTWRAESTPPGTSWTAVFRVSDARVIGVVSSCASNGPAEIAQATIKGNALTFQCTSGDGNRTLTFSGIIDGNDLSLTWNKQVREGATREARDAALFGDAAPTRLAAKRVEDAAAAADPRFKDMVDRLRTRSPVTFERILRADQEPHNWLTYAGTLSGSRHSTLKQITPDNVKNLELAWLWQPHPVSNQKFEATALVESGVLYTVQPPNTVAALEADTGRVLWTYVHTPAPQTNTCCGRVNRGLAILGTTLFLGTLDARLIALDAHTGTLLWNSTVADVQDPACKGRRCYSITHAPLVVKDKVIVGTAGSDAGIGEGIRGVIAAFDGGTGREVWRFQTIPSPGQSGHETWSGDSWKTGGAGVWMTGSYDPDLNLTYWGTGNPNPAPFPAQRRGDNLYSNSVVALDADTGALRWHYQFTPADDMDWDAGQVPVLADIDWQREKRRVMLFANKNGVFYVLDRTSGRLLMGTPFVEVNWMSGFDPSGRPLRVPGKGRGNGVSPIWGTNWSPASYSATTSLYYIPAYERASDNDRGFPVPGDGYAAIRAFDPRTGDRKWEFRRNNAVFAGGVLTTVSGLLFTGVWGDPNANPAAARLADGYFYALDARTGELQWQMALGGSIQSAAMTYAVRGKQYVTVAAGNTLFAFALRQ